MSPRVNGTLGPMELQRVEKPVSTPLKSLESFRGLVGKAIARIGWSQKRAALEMGLPETQFSRQLAGTENLSLWKLHAMPADFWLEWIVLLVDFWELSLAGTEQDRRDQEIGRMLRAVVERVGQR